MVSIRPINRGKSPPSKPIRALAAFLFLAIVGEIALATKAPLLFASLGPTTLTVVSRPGMKQNRPSSIIGGHLFGAAVATILLIIFGIYWMPSVIRVGFSEARIVVAALAVGLTTVFEEETPLYHPPAAATTLLVALGLMSQPLQLLSIVLGVVLITIASSIYEYFCPTESLEKVKKQISKKAVS
jgi:hypothetical protein